MKRHAKKAYTAIAKLDGGFVIDRQENGNHFILSAEDYDKDGLPAADYYQEYLRQVGDENPWGIRTDINAILEANGLYAEWINPGMLGVYDA